MSNCAANVGRGHEFAIAEYGTASGAAFTRQFRARRKGLVGNTTTVQDDGIDSVSWERINDEQIDQVAPSGSIELVPRANDLQSFLMCIAGDGAFATNQKLPGNICQYFQFGHADPYVDKVYRYNNCVTPSAVFSSSDSDPILRLAWNIEAQSRTVIDDVSANFPALTPSSQPPFVFRQGVLTVGGTAFKMKDFSLTITNNMILDDFHNSLTRAEMPLITQTFELTHTTPWDDPLEAAKVGTELSDVAISLNFVSGTKQILFEFPSMYEGEMDEPEVATQQRVRKQYSWKAKYDPADAIAAPVRFTVVET